MQEILEAFLEHPTANNYRAARQCLLADPDYRGDARQLANVADLCERRRFREAREVSLDMLPDWALSPRAHGYAAWIAQALGEEDEVELEQFLQSACMEGLLATGDGSPSYPYLVMHVSDEYDILDRLGETSQDQRLMLRGHRQFDILTSAAGREYWFDISDLMTDPRITPVHGTIARLRPARFAAFHQPAARSTAHRGALRN